ncbi:hypothetical protein GGS23DRAFT_609601 [Durotheca rogersii]|uniref:uncharacterized protein n=1 Tax=Durotheca rogersii TaxID=419775 RepID=UPI002220BFAE|nr:uncharacterized protein GGS23DRAFT_609601 [Durotheca rogersii]KAI5863147.1 hypothetical protein GGS23DRAFT_609601 [Durotheca rogersii]
MDAPLPKRRHILSSINPEHAAISPEPENDPVAPGASPRGEPPDPEKSAGDTSEARERKTTKFRFKSKNSRSHRSSRHDDRDRDRGRDRDRERERDGNSVDEGGSSSHRHHRRRHHHHHRRHKRRRTRSPTPPNPYDPPPLDPDAAFREALFDAMADDEGAAYWEHVYGQPLHIYGRAGGGGGSDAHDNTDGGGEDGKPRPLEQMDDEEYAAFVRRKMWEKTHEGLLEERARREQRRREDEERRAEEARLARDVERSLRRGEERRRRRAWRTRWDEYVAAWAAWDGAPAGVPWPVRSGRRDDVLADDAAAAVQDFYVLGAGPPSGDEPESAEDARDLLATLKEERVRWHPDKMQQRFGGKADDEVMRGVTAVFQVVDRLWSDTRAKKQ